MAADYSPSILLLDSTPQLIANWLLIVQSCRPRGLRVGRCSMWNHRKELCRDKVWMGELKYIVMDGCMLLNKSSTISENCNWERKRQALVYRVRQWCQNSHDLNWLSKNCEEFTNETSDRCLRQELDWTFFAVDNFPPCIPVTICPQYRALVAGQPEAAPFGPCCSCGSSVFTEHVMPFSVRAHRRGGRWPSWGLTS